MSGEGATKDPGGQQPEALPGLEAAAKSGMKPASQTNRAIPETEPHSDDLDREEREAADILNRNAQADTKKPA